MRQAVRAGGVRAGVGAILTLLVLLSSGCAYNLAGRGGGAASFIPPDVETIYVPMLKNETEQPEIELRLTEALIDELVQRGSFRAVADEADADVVLAGTIRSYRWNEISFTARGQYERLEITMTVSIELSRTSPEEVLWSQNGYIFREQYDVPESPQADVDRAIVAIEEMAVDFARSVVTTLYEGF